jgi:hypothetical protein
MPHNTPEKRRAYERAWKAANPEKCHAYALTSKSRKTERLRADPYYVEEQRAYRREYSQRWRAIHGDGNLDPVKRAFHSHRKRARKCGIDFLFTFEEWAGLWETSGKWDQRGRGSDKYCMARFGDKGPYAAGNVRICTNRENLQETRGRPKSDETRARMSQYQKSRPEAHTRNSAQARRGWVPSEETRGRISKGVRRAHDARRLLE